MNLQRILVLALFDLRHSLLRIKGLMFLLPFFLYWLLIMKLMYEGGIEFVSSQAGRVISILIIDPLFSGDAVEIAHTLFDKNPATLSIALILGLTMSPLFCILAGCNQLAGDAGRYSFRFLLTRCTRTELLLSRYFSSAALIAISYLVLGIGMSLLSLEIDHFNTLETFNYGLGIAFILIIYCPYCLHDCLFLDDVRCNERHAVRFRGVLRFDNSG